MYIHVYIYIASNCGKRVCITNSSMMKEEKLEWGLCMHYYVYTVFDNEPKSQDDSFYIGNGSPRASSMRATSGSTRGRLWRAHKQSLSRIQKR